MIALKRTTKFASNLQKKPFARYVLTGGVTYVFDIAVLVGMYGGLHTSKTLAVSASFWLGLLFSFLMQKIVAFKDFQKEIKAIGRQIIWYSVLVAVNYFVTVLIVNSMSGDYIILSRTIALAITTIWNYFIYKKLIFRER